VIDRISTSEPTVTTPQLRCRSGVSGSAAAIARRFILAPRRHPVGSSQATRGWFETLRLYKLCVYTDRALAGAAGEVGDGRDIPADLRRELFTRAVMQALLGFVSEARWLALMPAVYRLDS
jgi:hypothetical protein